MKNPYYAIWADAIHSYKYHHPNDHKWQLKHWFLYSFINGVNYWLLFIWLRYFEILEIPIFDPPIFSGGIGNSFLGFIFNFTLPFLVLNYLLVFRNKRYEIILNRYEWKKGVLAFSYVAIVLVLGFLSVLYHYSNA